jgi:hypothetical protein
MPPKGAALMGLQMGVLLTADSGIRHTSRFSKKDRGKNIIIVVVYVSDVEKNTLYSL